MSKNFGSIDFEHLTFPSHMKVDYIRVYQDMRHISIGCDPKKFPTAAYIRRYVIDIQRLSAIISGPTFSPLTDT
jgi:hypothetical protein